MTLPEILKAVRQWWWILVICPLIAAGTAFGVSSLITPMYEAESTVIIEHQLAGGTLDLQSIQAAERRTQTFSQLISTRSVIEPVIEELGLDETVDEVRSNLSASHATNTQLITISYQDPDPDHAAEVANAIGEQFSAYIQQIQQPVLGIADGDVDEIIVSLDAQIEGVETSIATLQQGDGPETAEEEERIAGLEAVLSQLQQSRDAIQNIGEVADFDASVGSQVYVVEPASTPDDPVSPRTILNVALAGVLGILLGGGLVVVASWLDDNVKTEDDIREILDRPVIGTIPVERLRTQMEDVHSGQSMAGELFRSVRTNLQFTMVDRSVKSIVVTSLNPGEGKTTMAANLAIVLAQGGQRVILVDADMRRPNVHNVFHRIRNDRGLSNLLLQSPAVIEQMLQSTRINNLKVLASGPLPPNPPDLLGSARMKALVGALEDSADIVIIDSPPMVVSESLLLSSIADGTLFVIRSGRNRTGDVMRAYESLAQTGAPILGVLLNGVPKKKRAEYQAYQHYYPVDATESDSPAVRQKSGWFRRLFTRGDA
jgi:polysaccharide biosynthesis transport protein